METTKPDYSGTRNLFLPVQDALVLGAGLGQMCRVGQFPLEMKPLARKVLQAVITKSDLDLDCTPAELAYLYVGCTALSMAAELPESYLARIKALQTHLDQVAAGKA